MKPLHRLFVCAALALAASARAHHVVSASGISPAQPGTSLRVELEAARFDLGGQQGEWQQLAFQGEYAPTPAFSVAVRLPMASVAYAGGRRTSGLADSEISMRLRLVATARDLLVLSGGAGLELPTGDPDRGLGGGHYELAPFLQASASLPGDWAVFGVVSALISLATGQGHGHPLGGLHGSVLAPHATPEGVARLGGGRAFARGFASAGLDLHQPVVAHASDRFLSARLDGGFAITPALRLLAGAELPLAGVPRFGARARLGLGWRF